MSTQGYIKLYRQLQEHEFWKEKRKFSKAEAWLDLLMLANHSKATIFVRGIEIKLNPGDLFWSQEQLSKRWKWSRQKTIGYIMMLTNKGMITYKVDNRIGITSICNWDKFQIKEQQTRQQTKQQKSDKPDPNNNEDNDNNEEKNINTVKNFKSKKTEILERTKELYPDKNVDLAMEDFTAYIESKRTSYKDFRLAFYNWVREDRFNKYSPNSFNGKGKMTIDII